jgi:hypothetical protein
LDGLRGGIPGAPLILTIIGRGKTKLAEYVRASGDCAVR